MYDSVQQRVAAVALRYECRWNVGVLDDLSLSIHC